MVSNARCVEVRSLQRVRQRTGHLGAYATVYSWVVPMRHAERHPLEAWLPCGYARHHVWMANRHHPCAARRGLDNATADECGAQGCQCVQVNLGQATAVLAAHLHHKPHAMVLMRARQRCAMCAAFACSDCGMRLGLCARRSTTDTMSSGLARNRRGRALDVQRSVVASHCCGGSSLAADCDMAVACPGAHTSWWAWRLAGGWRMRGVWLVGTVEGGWRVGGG